MRANAVLTGVFVLAGCLAAPQARTQEPPDSQVAVPPWRSKVRYGGGPSVGPPPSDFDGSRAPVQWCLTATGRSTGDLAGPWDQMSRGWLSQVLTDSTDHGAGWREVLGGAPRLAPADSIVQLTDETICREVALQLNRELLGWKVGPPPVVIYQLDSYLIVFPSNARMGEFGLAVGMALDRTIRGVATW